MRMARPRDRPGGRAFRCTWDKKNYVGIKAAILFTEGLHCMHWHARVARSVFLALTLLMMQTTQYACVCCEQLERSTFTSAFLSPTIRAVVRKKITLETRQTNTIVGGFCSAGPAPDLRHQPPGSTHFCKQNVGVGYTRYMYIVSILFRVYTVDMT